MLSSSFESSIRLRRSGSPRTIAGRFGLEIEFKPFRGSECKRSLREDWRVAAARAAHRKYLRGGDSRNNCRKGPPGPRRGGRCGGATPNGSSRQRHGRRGPLSGNGQPSVSRDGGVAGIAAVPGGPPANRGAPGASSPFYVVPKRPRATRAVARASPTKPAPGCQEEAHDRAHSGKDRSG